MYIVDVCGMWCVYVCIKHVEVDRVRRLNKKEARYVCDGWLWFL